MTPSKPNSLAWWLCAGIVLFTFLVFRAALQNDFVSYDDPDYVTEDPAVQRGLTADGVRWAFTTGHAGNWHPVTWLSHMADIQWHGLKPAGHHLTNLLLHCANAALVFALLRALTGAIWRSAIVAALFALHPLRVESVAWIAERKDVLSGFFGLLSLLAYVRYAQLRIRNEKLENRKEQRAGQTFNIQHSTFNIERCGLWYWIALVLFALGLMSKPMLVTLPFAMLLLDFWPLGRFTNCDLRFTILKSVREKIPFLVLTLASCVVTFIVQQRGGAMTGSATLPERLANAAVAYARYIGKSFWPENLAVFYPYPASWPVEQVAGAILLLAAISWLALRTLKTRPAFAVGWLWFLGMLVPTIGLVQVGGQSLADRYTYLPQIGLFVALIFSWPEQGTAQKIWRQIGVIAAPVACAVLALLTTKQILHWRDSETLFTHALAVTTRNEVAHNNLGAALQKRGDWAGAAKQHTAAIEIKSRYAGAHMNLGNCLLRLGDPAEALVHLLRAVELEPTAKAHHNLGTALLEMRRHTEARESFRQAVALDPTLAEARLNLGITETALGDGLAGARECQAAIDLRPDWATAWLHLGNAFVQQKNFAPAADAFASVLRLDAADQTALFNLANAQVELGRLPEAMKTLGQLLALNPGDLDARRLLANLGLRSGDAVGAVTQLEQVVRAAPTAANHLELAQALLSGGRRADALKNYRAALQLQPENPAVLNDLAWLLATHPDATARSGAEAAAFAEKACSLTERKNPFLLGTLAAALAEAGRFPEAIQSCEQAIALAKAAGFAPIVERNEELLKLYRAGRAFHEPAN